MPALSLPKERRGLLAAVGVAPVFVIFLSSNVVNAGNLAFNVLFSRWMGPELFGQLAALLTIKLALLGVLGALQMAVSQRVSAETGDAGALNSALARLSHCTFVALWLALPVILGLIWATDLHRFLGLGTPLTLFLFSLSLPFAAPLSLLRGVAIGRLDVRSVVLSANIEMAMRLLGGIVAWHLGGGLTGVVLAISASILAGWVPLVRLLPGGRKADGAWLALRGAIVAAAVPFALLQAAQVVLLDADVFVARATLGEAEAGYVAALSLFQRIQFFACFGLAGVLLPAVTCALANGQTALRPALSVLGLVTIASVLCLSGAALAPERLVSLLVGDDFLPAAPVLMPVTAAAVTFTLSYLGATFLAACGDRAGILLLICACPIQIGAMVLTTDDLSTMVMAKLYCQFGLCLLVIARICQRLALSSAARPRLVPLS